MNWKKFLLIGLAVSAFAFAATPRAEARVVVNFGFGLPFGVGYYGYGYPGCYPYGYNYYGYGPRRVVYVAPRYYRHYNYSRRAYYPRRHLRHWR